MQATTHTQTHTHTHTHTTQQLTNLTTQIKRLGGMREAIRRPTGGWRARPRTTNPPGTWQFPVQIPVRPLCISPAGPRIPPTRKIGPSSFLASQNAFKILIDFLRPFGSQKPPKIDPRTLEKSIKNRLNNQ